MKDMTFHVLFNLFRRSVHLRAVLVVYALLLALVGCGSMADQKCSAPCPLIGDGEDKEGAVEEPSLVRWPTPEEKEQKEVAPHRFIVAFRLPAGGKPAGFTGFAEEFRFHDMALQEIPQYADAGLKSVDFIAETKLSTNDTGKDGQDAIMPSLFFKRFPLLDDNVAPVASLADVEFESEEAAERILKEWEQEGRIWFAEPNYIRKLYDDYFGDLGAKYEALESNAWWVTKIRLSQAFKYIASLDSSKRRSDDALQGDPPVIAVMDSGVDYDHAALNGRIWQNPRVGEASCDNDVHGCNTTITKRGKLGDGNVYPVGLDGAGKSCATGDLGDKVVPCRHGTHVAGIIAGLPDAGVPGICPFCQIMIVKIVDSHSGNITDASILRGFKYVSLFRKKNQNVVRVINSSFGKLTRARSVALLIRLLRESGSGALVIAAAGNEETMRRSYPAAASDAIAVAAVGVDGRKASYSNFGPWVDVSAPGGSDKSDGGIVSSVPGGGVAPDAGTSMASPVVSGVAGLILAMEPDIPFNDLRNRIIVTANPEFYRAEFDEGRHAAFYHPKVKGSDIGIPLLGSGVVDAAAAVQNQIQTASYEEVLQRVRPGCGVVGAHDTEGPESSFIRYLLLVLPLLPLIILYSTLKYKEYGSA